MKLKKFSKITCLLIMALLVLSLSGCNDDHHSSTTYTPKTETASKLMVVSSTALVSGDEYTIYRGTNALTNGTAYGSNTKYYVASGLSSTPNSINLEFSGTASNDLPYVIVDSDDKVVFAYNPRGISNDTATEYGDVTFQNTSSTTLSYSSLNLSSSSVSTSATEDLEFDENDVINIVLSSNGTATVSGDSISPIEAVWSLSPDVGEYWTYNGNVYSQDEDAEKNLVKAIKANASDAVNYHSSGVYIARDIRYVPNTLTFSETTVTKANGNSEGDSDQLYPAYYSKGAQYTYEDDDDNKVTVTAQSADTYILAALPADTGMPGADSRNGAPDGNQNQQGGFGGNGQGGQPGGFGGSGGAQMPMVRTSSLTDVKSAMTHSASEAYNNPVFHITESGIYRISGTWNGQIWVDASKKKKVTLILNGVTVNCDVAPALVFKKVYEYGPNEDTEGDATTAASVAAKTSMDIGPNLAEISTDNYLNAGATVLLAAGTTNTFTGTNVARINRLEINTDDSYSETTSSLKYVKSLKKMYKLDGAFHSRMSMVIANEKKDSGNGTLIVSSDYEGLDSEEHLYIESGAVTVKASDDGINVNDDNVSVFHMAGGSLTVVSTGGDGIDSNGYIIFTGADKLSVTASSNNTKPSSTSGLNAQAEGPLDADCAIYMSEAVFSIYTVGDGATTDPANPTDSSSGSTSTTVSPVEDKITDNDVVTYQKAVTSNEKSQLSATQREALGVAASGSSFKLVEKYNDFSGVK